MKRILSLLFSIFTSGLLLAQTTYYWVGGTAPSTSITTGSNWNTVLDGTGSSRPSSTGATDILVFDGTNVAGSSPATGPVIVLANGSITCGQMLFVNNADISFIRTSSGTSTFTISGGSGDDFVMEAGTKLSFTSTVGSIRMAMNAANTGVISGALNMTTPLQARFDNTTSGTRHSLRFTSGASLTTNITSASSSYAFGSNSQSSYHWVVFESGSHIYYNGGFSPNGSGTGFSAIDMEPGSVWHHRANNPVTGAGNFFNRQNYGDVIVENNSTLNALGTIYGIENLTVNTGSTFIPYTSGQTVITGNVIVHGNYASPAGSTNELVFAGHTPQSLAGNGTVTTGRLIIADRSDVTLGTNLSVEDEITVFGKLDLGSKQLSGSATFVAAGSSVAVMGTGNLTMGANFIKGNTTFTSSSIGKLITGTGIPANTHIVSFSSTEDSIYISRPVTSTLTGVSLSVSNDAAILENNNMNGFDPSAGSVITTGSKNFGDGISYIINGANTSPFGITTGSSGNMLTLGFAEVNAPVTLNSGFSVSDHLTINAKTILRPLDEVHINSGATLNGSFGAGSYLALSANGTTGDQSYFQYNGFSSPTILPVGTPGYYLPLTITPASTSDFRISVFEGITTNGAISGTPLTPSQKQTVVDAVWNINRLSGSGNADIQIMWDAALEGSSFISLPDTDIGLIKNNGSSWDAPIGTGDNTTNMITATLSSFGSVSAGAVPQVAPFVYNPLPVKMYGDADFNGGATSLNTTQPIIYTSSNTSVATIVNGEIHITGAGTTDITASQATDGFYPAASITHTLSVNKAPLTIKADDQLKFEGQPNPVLTATYTGFVLGETPAVLLTQAVLTTTAVTASPPGTYPITVTGATSNNYDITFQNGVLTVQAKLNQTITFNALPTKTYGNADFAAGATSTNNTIPITYTSSNTSVATINSSGIIHITGAGTTTITASQAGNAGYFAAADVARTLTVNKVNLTIRVLDTSKIYGTPNPDFTIVYTGFVLNESVANLTSAPAVATTATTNSTPGYYAITVQGAVSQNYNITYISGRLTILPRQGANSRELIAFYNTGGSLTVRVYSPEPTIGDIVVYDMNGRSLIKRNLFIPAGFIQTNLSIPALTSGTYVITVRGEGIDLKKLISIIK